MSIQSRVILVIDHGSRRPEAHDSLLAVAERIRALVDRRALVAIAHMEIATPSVAEAIDQCVAQGVNEVIAVPYLLAPGRHATEDIPRLVREAVAKHPGVSVRVTDPLGVDDLLARLVLKRAGLPFD
jgi:sirohydrochlorin ferrochelatase